MNKENAVRAGEVVQVIQYLLSKPKALSSTSVPQKIKCGIYMITQP
jgi:hypothetical protein